MKKFFIFAIALVASVLAFSSCDKKDKEKDGPNQTVQDDVVVFNAIGELRGVMFDCYNAQQQAVIKWHKEANTIDVKFVQARIVSDDETPQDIYIYNMPLNQGEAHIKLLLADSSAYTPFPKSYAYAIMDDEQTMFNMHFGNDDENDTQVYLVFNAMLEAEPSTDLNPADLIGTMWRTEGVYFKGEQSAAPHFYLQILTAEKAAINRDTVSYSFDGNQLNCAGDKYEVTEYTGTTAKLRNGDLEINLTKMPELDMDAMIMDPKSEDFVGTWKLAYFTMDYFAEPGYEDWHNLGTNPGVETWELRADGTATYKSSFTGETKNGTWSWDYGLLMVENPANGILQDENDRITVQPLTKNWMSILRGVSVGTSSSITYYQWWFVRVK